MSWNNWTADGEANNDHSTSALVAPEDLPPNGLNGSSERNIRTSWHNAHEQEGYRGSVIGSARDAGGGMIVNRSVTSKDRVSLPGGGQTSVAVAAQLGYLVRNADGSFSDAGSTGEAQQGQADEDEDTSTEDETSDEGFGLGDEGEAVVSELFGSVQHGDAIRALGEILEGGGDVSENTLSRLASAAQMEPDQMAEKVNEVHDVFHAAISDHLTTQGVFNHDAFEAFVGDHPQLLRKLADGSRAVVMHNDTTHLDDVAAAFIEKAPDYAPDDVADALEDAGIESERRPDGVLMLNIQGMMVPWNVAVRQQLIALS